MSKNIKMLFVFIVFLIYLIIPGVNASQIASQDVSIELFDDFSAKLGIMLNFSDITTTEVYYIVSSRISNIKAFDSGGPVSCTMEQLSYGTQIVCVPNVDVSDGYIINLYFDAFNLQKTEGQAILFSYNLGVMSPTDSVSVSVVLPDGMGLVEMIGDVVPYFPSYGTIGSTGRNINIYWSLFDLSLGKTYSFEATYETLSLSESDNLFIYLILIIIISYFIFLKFFSKPKVETILSVLKKDEKSVLDIIMSSGGSCIQRKIVKETDFSKARVSRIIRDLGERGLIRKVPRGRTNLIEFISNKQLKNKDKK
ncbi:MAG: hypothetical protein K0B02_00225 [DPANN group archaeon]|nr:hypothetical protein [DPANN group archaeon]